MINWRNLIISLLLFCACSPNKKAATKVKWKQTFSKDTFEQAKKEGKLVLLTLEANWCHWCHVMEDSTYSNSEVISFLNEYFICVSVDQDAHPELASRYRKYGWPATIVLNVDGDELLKKAGFMSPETYISELKNALNSGKAADNSLLSKKVTSTEVFQERLTDNFDTYLDFKHGGFKSAMKYTEEESFEYALFHANNTEHQNWLNLTIQGSYELADPVWGGIYQYSTQSDWKHPHYEKLLHIQARYMRLFLNDYAYTDKANSLSIAQQIKQYCDRFLKQKNGLYANAQDADLIKGKKASAYFSLSNEKRLKLGIPAIDTNTYTNSNADFARSLLKLYALNKQKQDSLQYQIMLAQLVKRKNERGLYQHSFQSNKTCALRDNLAMAQLFVEHVKCFPQDDKIQARLAELMQQVVLQFKLPNGSYKGFTGDLGIAPEAVLEENIPLGRLFNWYAGFSGKTYFKQESKNMLKHLQRCDAQERFFHEPGVLMLMRELNEEAQSHVSANEQKPYSLLRKAYVFAPFFSYFKVLEKGKNKAYDELFSGVSGVCLFMCTSTFCTSPIRNEDELARAYKNQN